MTAASMREVRTAHSGAIETAKVPEEAVLTFPEGLPGFERHTTFALLDDERLEPFHWLQATDDPHIGFLVIEPAAFTSDYAFDIPDAKAELLALDDTVEPEVFCILTVPGDVRAMTANLRAPLVINRRRRLAKQVILADERYPLRHPVFGQADAERASC